MIASTALPRRFPGHENGIAHHLQSVSTCIDSQPERRHNIAVFCQRACRPLDAMQEKERIQRRHGEASLFD
jgi:hypothetical protein